MGPVSKYERRATRWKEPWGQAFSIYYPPAPENTTLLDILNIAGWTHGLTTSLRNSKSNRLVNAAAENSPIRASHSYYLFFLITSAFFCSLPVGHGIKSDIEIKKKMFARKI